MKSGKDHGSGGASRFLPSFLRENLGLKIAAFLLALLVYLSIRAQIDSTTDVRNVTVNIKTPNNRILLDDKPCIVTVGLKGSKSLINKVTNSDITINADAKEVTPTQDKKFYKLKLDLRWIQTPFGTRAVEVKPETITLALDDIENRMVKVEPIFADRAKMPPEYTIGKVTVTPAEVRVEAPASKLTALKQIQTTPISLSEITHSFDCDQELDQKSYPQFTFSPAKVLVQVEILPSVQTRTFNALPVRILSATATGKERAFSCEIVSAPTVDVTVSGAKNIIETLRKEDFLPYVDISKFDKPGLYEIDVKCASERDGVKTRNIYPSRISVKLEKTSDR